MIKSYKSIINWNIVNMRAKNKQLPHDNCRILFLSEIELFKPTIEFATIHNENDENVYAVMYNGIKVPINTDFKWCYIDDIEHIIEE